ncbi:hypothetical protein E2C01_021316 [Portunus trituberculatus]|uniref:Uncharacterized protein n=1 Tax=Portunus trituberculatus TaxID=210409 RepID=A0A5B7E2A5_PORTR|nr:hypothetical protein [Portunus trituberculatus]
MHPSTELVKICHPPWSELPCRAILNSMGGSAGGVQLGQGCSGEICIGGERAKRFRIQDVVFLLRTRWTALVLFGLATTEGLVFPSRLNCESIHSGTKDDGCFLNLIIFSLLFFFFCIY